MKKMRTVSRLCAVLLLLAGAMPVFAANGLTGNWTTEVQTPDGFSIPVSLSLQQEGARLTGSVAAPATSPIAIDNGKVMGNKVFFTVSLNGITVTNVGTIVGDEIKMTSKPSDHTQFQDYSLVLKRSH